MTALEVHPATRERWSDLVDLFGAAGVEAYPHVSKASDYMGGLDLYLGRGFRPVRHASKRAVVRLPLS